jgi:hypothetical protein
VYLDVRYSALVSSNLVSRIECEFDNTSGDVGVEVCRVVIQVDSTEGDVCA